MAPKKKKSLNGSEGINASTEISDPQVPRPVQSAENFSTSTKIIYKHGNKSNI